MTVTLPAGDGFAVKDNTGSIERLRVDEATRRAIRNPDTVTLPRDLKSSES